MVTNLRHFRSLVKQGMGTLYDDLISIRFNVMNSPSKGFLCHQFWKRLPYNIWCFHSSITHGISGGKKGYIEFTRGQTSAVKKAKNGNLCVVRTCLIYFLVDYPINSYDIWFHKFGNIKWHCRWLTTWSLILNDIQNLCHDWIRIKSKEFDWYILIVTS